MTLRHLIAFGLSGLLCVAFNPAAQATNDHDNHDAPVGLLKAVRDATTDFRDVTGTRPSGAASPVLSMGPWAFTMPTVR